MKQRLTKRRMKTALVLVYKQHSIATPLMEFGKKIHEFSGEYTKGINHIYGLADC
jgi:hypothetical protein